jgi:hypothetical protein
MNNFQIAWRSIRQRGVASSLTMFSMALGVMLVVLVLSIYGIVSREFDLGLPLDRWGSGWRLAADFELGLLSQPAG